MPCRERELECGVYLRKGHCGGGAEKGEIQTQRKERKEGERQGAASSEEWWEGKETGSGQSMSLKGTVYLLLCMQAQYVMCCARVRLNTHSYLSPIPPSKKVEFLFLPHFLSPLCTGF